MQFKYSIKGPCGLSQIVFFSRANQVIRPMDKTDLTLLSVEELIETPVATGSSVFESKLDSLADSMARMSDSLSRFTQPRAATSTKIRTLFSMKGLRVSLTPLRLSLTVLKMMVFPNFPMRV